MTKRGRPPIGKRAMTATERDRRRRVLQRLPWWERTKAQQKADVENALRQFLYQNSSLSDRQMYFIAEAINAVERGLFGMAVQAIIDAKRPDSDFSPLSKIPPDNFKGVTLEVLRNALHHSEMLPVQETPIFR